MSCTYCVILPIPQLDQDHMRHKPSLLTSCCLPVSQPAVGFNKLRPQSQSTVSKGQCRPMDHCRLRSSANKYRPRTSIVG